jgi:hypothetical protein
MIDDTITLIILIGLIACLMLGATFIVGLPESSRKIIRALIVVVAVLVVIAVVLNEMGLAVSSQRVH